MRGVGERSCCQNRKKKKQVEIYNLDYDENGQPQYYLWETITENNKDELKIVHFQNLKITFDELFAGFMARCPWDATTYIQGVYQKEDMFLE